MSVYKSLSDLQLAGLLKQDDEAAFTEIYHRYAEKLSGFAGSKLYSLEDTRDIIHDIFVKLWTDRKLLNIERSLEAYLFTVVRYRVIDKIRRNITHENYREMIEALDKSYGSETEEHLEAKDLRQQIDKALGGLSPRVREIYRLSREENRSIAEIADQLQLSEQTVKNQLSTALKHLRASLTYLSLLYLLLG